MKKISEIKTEEQKKAETVAPGAAIVEKSESEILKERSVIRQLAADYKKLGMHSQGALFMVAMEIPILKLALAKAMSAATALAVNLFRAAIGQAAKVSGAVAVETTAKVGAGTVLSAVFSFIEGYKAGAFISPYVFGDMSNYVTKSKALVRLLEDNMDREGAKTDPKIKALNDEMNGYQFALSSGSYGLSQAAEQHYGGGMKALQAKTPALQDAAATAKHVKLILDAMKDINGVMNACKNIASEDFKKRFYDVHYVQGSWVNPFSQDLNQMQNIATSAYDELNKTSVRASDYISKTFAFGDQLIANVGSIFEEEKKTATSNIIKSYIKVAKILSLYK